MQREGRTNEINTHDWLGIRKALTTYRAIERDWGLCHLWGGKTGRRMLNGLGFIDYSFGHEPLGADTCEHHNADPAQKASIQISGKMPPLKLEGELQ